MTHELNEFLKFSYDLHSYEFLIFICFMILDIFF